MGWMQQVAAFRAHLCVCSRNGLQCTDWRGKGNTLAGAVTRGAYLVMKGDSHCVGNRKLLELTWVFWVQVLAVYPSSI